MSDARSTSALDYVLGRKLRLARTEAGLSQQALAEKLGITFQQVQKYEKGANRIAASRLVSIAAAVNQPISYFLDETHSGGRVKESSSADPGSLTALFASIDSARVRRRVIEMLRKIADSEDGKKAKAAPAAKAKRKPVKKAARGRRN